MRPDERQALVQIISGLREGRLTNEEAIDQLIQLGAAASPEPADTGALRTRSTPDTSTAPPEGTPRTCASTGFLPNPTSGAGGTTYTVPNNSSAASTPRNGTYTIQSSAKETSASCTPNGSPVCPSIPGYYQTIPNPAEYSNMGGANYQNGYLTPGRNVAGCQGSMQSNHQFNTTFNVPNSETGSTEFWADLNNRIDRLYAVNSQNETITPVPRRRPQYAPASSSSGCSGPPPNGRSRSQPPARSNRQYAVGPPCGTPENQRWPRNQTFNVSDGRSTPSFRSPGVRIATDRQGTAARQLNFSGYSGGNTDPASYLVPTQNAYGARGRYASANPAGRALNFSGTPDPGNATFNVARPAPCPPDNANGGLPPQNIVYDQSMDQSGYASFEYVGSQDSTIYGPAADSIYNPTPNASLGYNQPMNSTRIRDAPPCPPPFPGPRTQTPGNATFNVAGPRTAPGFNQTPGNATFNVAGPQIAPGFNQTPGNATFNVAGPQIAPGFNQTPGNATFNVAGPQIAPGFNQTPGNATFNVAGPGFNQTYNVPGCSPYSVPGPRTQTPGNAAYNVAGTQTTPGLNGTYNVPCSPYSVPGPRTQTPSQFESESMQQSGVASWAIPSSEASTIFGRGDIYFPTPGARRGGDVPLNSTKIYGPRNLPEPSWYTPARNNAWGNTPGNNIPRSQVTRRLNFSPYADPEHIAPCPPDNANGGLSPQNAVYDQSMDQSAYSAAGPRNQSPGNAAYNVAGTQTTPGLNQTSNVPECSPYSVPGPRTQTPSQFESESMQQSGVASWAIPSSEASTIFGRGDIYFPTPGARRGGDVPLNSTKIYGPRNLPEPSWYTPARNNAWGNTPGNNINRSQVTRRLNFSPYADPGQIDPCSPTIDNGPPESAIPCSPPGAAPPCSPPVAAPPCSPVAAPPCSPVAAPPCSPVAAPPCSPPVAAPPCSPVAAPPCSPPGRRDPRFNYFGSTVGNRPTRAPCSPANSLPSWGMSSLSGSTDVYEASPGQIIDLDIPYASTPAGAYPPRSPTPTIELGTLDRTASTPPDSFNSYLQPTSPYRIMRCKVSPSCFRNLSFTSCIDSPNGDTSQEDPRAGPQTGGYPCTPAASGRNVIQAPPNSPSYQSPSPASWLGRPPDAAAIAAVRRRLDFSDCSDSGNDPNATFTVPNNPNATFTVPNNPNATFTVPNNPNATFGVPNNPNATFAVPNNPNATFAVPNNPNATFAVPNNPNATFTAGPRYQTPGNATYNVGRPQTAPGLNQTYSVPEGSPYSVPGPGFESESMQQSGVASWAIPSSQASTIYGRGDIYFPTPGARRGGDVPLNSTRIYAPRNLPEPSWYTPARNNAWGNTPGNNINRSQVTRRLNFSPYADPEQFPPPCSPDNANGGMSPQNIVYDQSMDQSGYASFEYVGSQDSSIYGPAADSIYNPTPNASLGYNQPMNSTRIRDAPPRPPGAGNGGYPTPEIRRAGGPCTSQSGPY